MSTSQAVVIWGEVLWDQFPDGPQLGGAPANVAWHLGLAGGWPRLVSRVGDDELGRRAVTQLFDAGVDVSLVQVDRERATGTVEVKIERGEPRYTLVADRAWERIAFTEEARLALVDAGVLVYGTLAQRTHEGLEAWHHAIEAARGTCLKVYDLNLRKRTNTDLEERAAVELGIAAADMIKVNDRELAALAQWRGWRDPVGTLRDGRRIVVVTHGAKGSTIYTNAGSVEVAGVRAARAIDNVGCGDAYVALFVHGMTLGWDPLECGLLASRWAAAVAEARGVTPRFSDERIAALLEDTE